MNIEAICPTRLSVDQVYDYMEAGGKHDGK